ncbi:type III secretion system inner membrane ring lipoprotein SctJ [Photobacterium sp. OFAV2-7]|uniref:type III secretion system inner membrane ring lipoprotein SctJ n=1 Tax=Photobacterium sp. OFAV2-7 TaxID=2917748 RepID=UPI001EF4AA09|nr:type III secretion inner membrane ring lipoprotein SctJ [Photobacterium sp. OFAV2-7]MCG7587240.1 type III secretion inner membrane ring lipoprotein SctJ [Photobacterium sp. OFAV2-7]
MSAVSFLAPRWLRWLLIALVVCLLQGCKDNLYSNLSEQDANQMLALLLNHGVDAEKQGASSDTISLKVEKTQFAYAVELLKQNGYPRERFSTVEDLFPQDGLVATPTQEKARFVYALSQALAETLNQIDGVISARVHLVVPETVRGATLKPSSAAVFIKHAQNTDVGQLIPQIKSLIQNSIEGLKYDDVQVVMVASQVSAQLLAPVVAENLQPTPMVLYGLIGLLGTMMLVLIGVMIWQRRQQKRRDLEVLERVTQSQ